MATPIDTLNLIAVHENAIAEYESDAAEMDAEGYEYTAWLYRQAAEKRRKLIAELEARAVEPVGTMMREAE